MNTVEQKSGVMELMGKKGRKYLGKSWKTTAMGILGVIMILVALGLVFTGKATLTEVTAFGGALGAILATILSFLTKDYDAKDDDKSTGNPEEYL